MYPLGVKCVSLPTASSASSLPGHGGTYLFSAEGSAATLPAIHDALGTSCATVVWMPRREGIGIGTSTTRMVYDDPISVRRRRLGHCLPAPSEESAATRTALMDAGQHCCADLDALVVRWAGLDCWSAWAALERTDRANLVVSIELDVPRHRLACACFWHVSGGWDAGKWSNFCLCVASGHRYGRYMINISTRYGHTYELGTCAARSWRRVAADSCSRH